MNCRSMFLILGLSILLGGCSQLVKEDSDHQISTIDYFYPIRDVDARANKEVTDRSINILTLNKMNKCDSDNIELSPYSLGVSESEFNIVWRQLLEGMNEGKKFIFSYGKCGVDGPAVTKVEPCTPQRCG